MRAVPSAGRRKAQLSSTHRGGTGGKKLKPRVARKAGGGAADVNRWLPWAGDDFIFKAVMIGSMRPVDQEDYGREPTSIQKSRRKDDLY